MKTARCVLRFVALGFSIASTICLIIAYWDKIVDFFYNIADKLEEEKSTCFDDSEFDDFADCEL